MILRKIQTMPVARGSIYYDLRGWKFSGSVSFQILYEHLSNFIEIISQNIYYGGINISHLYDNFHLQIIVF